MLLYIVDTATLDLLDHFVLRLCLRTLMQATFLYDLSLNTIDDDGPDELFCSFVYLTGGICGKVFVGVCRQ